MQNIKTVSFFFVFSLLILSPVCAFGLTFTLSDDAIMALDYAYKACGSPSATILDINDVPGPGVKFDILFSDPLGISGNSYSLYWTSYIYSGNGVLAGRNISLLDAFALKFTLLSVKGVSSPDKVGPLVVGSLINQSYCIYSYRPEWIAINDPYKPVSTSSVTTLDASQISMIGFVCYVPYWYYDESNPSPWDADGAIASILIEPEPNALVMTSDSSQVFQLMKSAKCTVAAGRVDTKDSISVSGEINAATNNLLDADVIEVNISSGDIPAPCIITFPIDNKGFLNNGRFTYSGIENGVKKSFKLDLKTHKFSFSAKNIDLSGLTCPANIKIDINDYNSEDILDETIVNGPKKPIPINLLMGIKNSIRVDRISAKYGSKKATDRLYVKGGISIANLDANLVNSDFILKLAGQPFTIPANNFKTNKAGNRFTCSNVKLSDGSIASADFNFKTCTFSITIKKVSLDANPDTTGDLSIEFVDFYEVAEGPYTLKLLVLCLVSGVLFKVLSNRSTTAFISIKNAIFGQNLTFSKFSL